MRPADPGPQSDEVRIANLTANFPSLFLSLQKRWRTRPALDQKGRKRIGQLSNGIDLTTQQVQQASTERLPLDEHSQEVSELLNDRLRDGAIRLSRRWRIHRGKVERKKTFDDKILFFVTI
jgi:hypothetical protein